MPASDRPDDRIINDDVELDAWLTRWIRAQAIKAKGQNPNMMSLDPVRAVPVFSEDNK